MPYKTTLNSPLAEWAFTTPANPAIVSPSGSVITYQRLGELVTSWGLILSSQGLYRQTRIALVLPNGPEMAVTFLGVTSVAACAPLNPSYSKEEFTFYLQDTRCTALMVPGDSPSAAVIAAHETGIPCYHLRPIPEVLSGVSPVMEWEIPPERKEPYTIPYSRPDDIALILHTSGTTGTPKRVPLRQDRICRNAYSIAGSLNLTPHDRCLNMMPLFHVHGLIGCLLATLSSGGSIITAPGFQPDRIAVWLSEQRPTWYSAVPAIHHSLLRIPGQDDGINHHLRFIRSCSSPLPPSLLHDLEERFSVPVIEAYGMTEAAHQITSNLLPSALHKPGSVGISSEYQISIRDMEGRERKPGERGEVWISGMNLFSGYEENPDANAVAFREGYFRTGDEGYLDDDGYLYLTGRIKELINKGGEMVAPREIEEVFLKLPGVDQAVAFSLPHPALGEDIGLIIVPSLGTTLEVSELKQQALLHLAPWKVPSQIRIMEEIPKGPTGKVRRREIAEFIASHEEGRKPLSHDKGDEISSDLEYQIRLIWEQVLQCEALGPDDDFFEIGGYSLTALAITSELERTFGIDLPPTVLFEAPTIQKITDMIRKKISGENIPYLVCFNPSGDRVPLFLVPPGRGNAFYYRDFASLLGRDQPFYSFSWLPPDHPSTTIEQMAETYVGEILRVLPSGPLLLGGYCFGAVIALEMAHRIQAMGREVKCLIIIDPETLLNGPGWRWEPRKQSRKELLLWLIHGGPRLWHRYALAVFNRRIMKPRITAEDQKRREKSMLHVSMLRNYHARKYAGNTLVVHHENVNDTLKDRWAILCGASAETMIIPGTKHHEVLEVGKEQIAEIILGKTGEGEGF